MSHAFRGTRGAAGVEAVPSPTDLLPERGRAILVNARNRDLEEQFDRIMREHGPAISRLASSYELIPSSREELSQDIALAIWQALPHFRGQCSERTFIFRIAHNRGLSHVWKRKPSHQSLDDLPEHHHPLDPRPHPEEQTAQQDRRARLMSAIHSLPVMHRQTILLMPEDLSHAEIAEILGITEINVAVRLNRARQALKEALEVRS
jgi:RNA polymerase sigma factor (sigma-70 family)